MLLYRFTDTFFSVFVTALDKIIIFLDAKMLCQNNLILRERVRIFCINSIKMKKFVILFDITEIIYGPLDKIARNSILIRLIFTLYLILFNSVLMQRIEIGPIPFFG